MGKKVTNEQQITNWRAIAEGGRIIIAKPPGTPRTLRENRLAYRFSLSRRMAYQNRQHVNQYGNMLTEEEYLALAEEKVRELQ